MLSHLIFVVPLLEQGELKVVQVEERVHRLEQVAQAGCLHNLQSLGARGGLDPENLQGATTQT